MISTETIANLPLLKVLLLADARSQHTERLRHTMSLLGCDVHLASVERGEQAHLRLGIDHLPITMQYLLSTRKIRHLIRHQIKPDIISAHYATGYGFAAAIASLGLSVPSILHLWGSDILIAARDSRWSRLKSRIALKSASLVHADSTHLLEAARRIESVTAETVIPWGIEREYIPGELPPYSGAVPLSIISPRPHEPVYNHLFALEVLRPYLEKGLVKWTLPVWGSESSLFIKKAGALTDTSVRLYSPLNRGAAMKLIASHQAYLSCAESDSSPVSLLEAMGLGLVPICASTPGISDWATESSALLFPVDNGEELRRSIDLVLNGNLRLDLMRRANHARISREACFEENVGRLVAIMHETVREERER